MTTSADHLPVALDLEPLVSATFELRFKQVTALADTLPGYLLHNMKPQPSFRRLPVADLPQPFRANDPNLAYSPVFCLETDQGLVAIGDKNIVIECKLPYPKWPTFKNFILDDMKLISNFGADDLVSRFSIKYVNLISALTLDDQIKKIDLSMKIGGASVSGSPVNVQVYYRENQIVHRLSITTGVNGCMPDGATAHGVVVDVDSVMKLNPLNFSEFVLEMEPDLERLKLSNKKLFFTTLSNEAIEQMRPRYD